MQPFTTLHPRTTAEAVALFAEHGERALLCAGGTDLIPNIKHGLFEPEVVIHLGRVAEMVGIEETETHLIIGAGTTLHQITQSAAAKTWAPGLVDAAAQVAGPQLRRMGTLGGNLCLDTRCLYYNQTHFWREALGYCLKKDGTVCHVVQGGKRCVAAASNDTATMLLCLDAEVVIENPEKRRTLPLAKFYVPNGAKNTVLENGDLVVSVRVPKFLGADHSGVRRLEGYAKLRRRQAIDYPMLSVAFRADVDENDVLHDLQITVSALAARPNRLNTDAHVGEQLDDALIDTLCALAHRRCNPLTNIADDPDWRKEMVPIYLRRAIDSARAR
jgi:4-hydroxybenzoyl-CoA reductase subunit beta